MARPTPRPRFTLRTALTPAEVKERVNALVRRSKAVRGIAFEHRVELAVAGGENHFWSPQIVVQMQPGEEGGAVLACRFGPDPYVWALYVLLYATMLGLFAFALIFGFVQLSLAMTPIGLYLAPLALVLAGLIYGASFVGQGLGVEQMYLLRAELTRVVEAEDGADATSLGSPGDAQG